MNTCSSCGKSVNAHEAFCSSCGNKLSNEQTISQSSIPNEQFNNQANTTSDQKTRISTNFSPTNNFVSKDEYVVTSLSNGFVDNILSGEGFKSEGAVLTNKRLYYNHRKGIINTHTQEEKIDVKDITGTKIATYNPGGLLVLSILFLAVGVLLTIVTRSPSFWIAHLVFSLFFLLIYLFLKKAYLRIEYAGGVISFSVKKYGIESIRKFQKSIHAVKDYIEENKK